MDYTPSISELYEETTGEDYRNNVLRDSGRDTFFGAVYQLRTEYERLDSEFTRLDDGATDHYYYDYTPDGGSNQPELRAYVLLARYLSAVYRTIEALRISLSTAARVERETVGLHPPIRSVLSEWDDDDREGQQPWGHACDEVLTRFTYLRGIRNAVVHGSFRGFSLTHDDTDHTVLVEIDPDELDSDPALDGYDDPSGQTYSFCDTYLRFEHDTADALHPVDNVFEHHDTIIEPFVQKFATKL